MVHIILKILWETCYYMQENKYRPLSHCLKFEIKNEFQAHSMPMFTQSAQC